MPSTCSTTPAAKFYVLAADGFAAIPRDAVWPACAAFLAEVCIRLADGP